MGCNEKEQVTKWCNLLGKNEVVLGLEDHAKTPDDVGMR